MNITIVGTGLMGCSLGLSLMGKGNLIFGCDTNPLISQQALEMQAFNEIITLEEAKACSDLIILATPVDVIVQLLPQLLSTVSANCCIMDLGSAKEQICQSVLSHPNRQSFVAAHPMAGKEIHGAINAEANLFINKPFVVCDHELSSSIALYKALSIIESTGSIPYFCSAQEHDRVVALVSHLPQLISYAFTSLEGFQNSHWQPIAASGYDSVARLADSETTIWYPILKQNIVPLKSLVNELNEKLQYFIDCIENNDTNCLHQNIQTAQRIRAAYMQQRQKATSNHPYLKTELS